MPRNIVHFSNIASTPHFPLNQTIIKRGSCIRVVLVLDSTKHRAVAIQVGFVSVPI